MVFYLVHKTVTDQTAAVQKKITTFVFVNAGEKKKNNANNILK